jgi:AcrR family transcriptional regulator
MKTRKKILLATLHLFNTQGMVQVSLREIARHLEISDGNLRYHFKTKAALVEGLYQELVQELNTGIGAMTQPQSVSLQTLYDSFYFTYECLYRYRFLMLDFVSIMRAHPLVLGHFRELQKSRREQFDQIMQLYIQQGLIRPEAFPDEYQALQGRLQILSDFWIASAEIMYQGSREGRLEYYVWLNFGLIYPYLTEKGKNDFGGIGRKLV